MKYTDHLFANVTCVIEAVNWLAKCRYHFVHVKKEIDTDKHVAICVHRLFYISLQSVIIIVYNTITQSHGEDADRAQRTRAFCRIRTVPRQQCIAFRVQSSMSGSMTRRLAILENVPLAVISQSPYASTTRGTHLTSFKTTQSIVVQFLLFTHCS